MFCEVLDVLFSHTPGRCGVFQQTLQQKAVRVRQARVPQHVVCPHHYQ